MLSSTNLLSAGEVGQASADERIAVMEAVKAGRVSIDEAIAAIKSVAISKVNPTTPNTQRRRTTKARKQAEKEAAAGVVPPYPSSAPAPTTHRPKVTHTELNRRNNGGIRKARGRIDLDVRLEKNGAGSSVVIDLRGAANLQPDNDSESNRRIISPYARMFLTNDKSGRKPVKPKQTATHKHDADPTFNEGYSWELQMGKTTNLSNCFAVVQIWDDMGRLRRAKFLGGMAFSLEQVLMGGCIDGWFKLLSAPKANSQNIPWHPGLERVASADSMHLGGDGGGGLPPPMPNTASGHPSLRPLPSLPIEAALDSPRRGGGGGGGGSMASNGSSRLSWMCKANGVTKEEFLAAQQATMGEAAAEDAHTATLKQHALEEAAAALKAAKVALVAKAEAKSAASAYAKEVKQELLEAAAAASMGGGNDGSHDDGANAEEATEEVDEDEDEDEILISTPTTTASAASAAAASQQPTSLSVNSFDYITVLGEGSFGKVFLADLKGTDDTYAVKVLRKNDVLDDDDVGATMTEKNVLALSAGCPFLTRMFATFQSPEKLYYVMEFLSGGDLMHHIQERAVFPETDTRFYTAEISLGLWYLHDNGIIYRDLKLDNVMLCASGHVKIADFGMCKENMIGGNTTNTFCGTPGYLAPEIIREQAYDHSVDWWSLGVMVYEMLCGESPFEAEDEGELFELILSQPIEMPDDIKPETESFLKGILIRDPKKRLGCGDSGRNNIKYHPFFNEIDWAKLAKQDVTPPFQPPSGKGGARDTSNFDSEFTKGGKISVGGKGAAREQPVGEGHEFNGFSFIDQSMFAALAEASSTDLEKKPPRARQREQSMFTRQRSCEDEGEMVRSLLRDTAWFRPDFSRKEVTQALKSTPAGTFYVRESSSQANSYALSVAVGSDKKPWSGLISLIEDDEDGSMLYRLFAADKFSTIQEVIDFYSAHPVVPDGDITLRVPQ